LFASSVNKLPSKTPTSNLLDTSECQLENP
jgi:hypothetical protein